MRILWGEIIKIVTKYPKIFDIKNQVCYITSCLRSWRNRQTRTFEGRMGDRMGSSPIDRTKKMTCTFIVQVFFLQGSKGLERDVKKTARCAVFSPRRDSNRVSGAKKGARNACARRVAEQVPSTAPTEKTIMLSSFFHFMLLFS